MHNRVDFHRDGFGGEIHRDFDFLGSLCGRFDSLQPLFMRCLGSTGRPCRIVVRFVIPSSIGDTPIRRLKKASRLQLFQENYIARYLDRAIIEEAINERAYP
jgi:hypothetical protein